MYANVCDAIVRIKVWLPRRHNQCNGINKKHKWFGHIRKHFQQSTCVLQGPVMGHYKNVWSFATSIKPTLSLTNGITKVHVLLLACTIEVP